MMSILSGLQPHGAALHERLERLVSPEVYADPLQHGWILWIRSLATAYLRQDPWTARAQMVEAAELLERSDDPNTAIAVSTFVARMSLCLGAEKTAERQLDESLRRIVAAGIGWIVPAVKSVQCLLLARRGAFAEARVRATEGIATSAPKGNRAYEAEVRVALAYALLLEGEGAAAEREARAARDLLGPFGGPTRAIALPVLSQALLARGQADEALAMARESTALAVPGGILFEQGPLSRLALAEALLATGARREARAVIEDAQGRLDAIAARLDESEREDFFARIPEHARTRALHQSVF
jgi:ATP/maltotriose-dependent transcriptional regulator MalT